MSIAPFLPGIPALVPADGQVPDQAAESPDGRPGFGDAFAAALAGALAVPAAPLPVLTSLASVAAPTEQKAEATVPGADRATGQATVPPLPLVDLALPTRESGLPTVESALPNR